MRKYQAGTTGDRADEHWIPVAGWDAYEVSDRGRVRRMRPGRGVTVGGVLTPWLDQHGYRMVALCQDGVPRKLPVHRIVASSFAFLFTA